MRRTLSAFLFTVLLIFISSCGNDDARSCTICSSDQTTDFEVCRESNGEASVNGEDTDTDYDVYLADLEEEGVECGG